MLKLRITAENRVNLTWGEKYPIFEEPIESAEAFDEWVKSDGIQNYLRESMEELELCTPSELESIYDGEFDTYYSVCLAEPGETGSEKILREINFFESDLARILFFTHEPITAIVR